MRIFHFLLILIISVLSIHITKADEGMWLMTDVQNRYRQMSDLGLKLKPEDIFADSNSLKDAVVIFGNGCTGEVVSKQGLIFTNHHCGYNAIQSLSSVEKDYLNEGFWAKNQQEELPCKDLTIKFLRKYIDVSDSIIPFTDSLSAEARNNRIEEIIEMLTKKENLNADFNVQVKPFFNGNKYYLIVYEIYKDIRLTAAPPSSIGKFGADTDNWMWPRHNGDFAVFRIYADSSGKPAPYSKNNIPLKTSNHLSISLQGYQENDFSLILGFPGITDRYLTSSQVQKEYEMSNPLRIKIRELRQEILMNDMKESKKTEIQYASKYARSSNYWKYFIGQNAGIKRFRVIEKIKNREAEFIKWVSQDSSGYKEYGKILHRIDSLTQIQKSFEKAYIIYSEAFRGSVEISTYIQTFFSLSASSDINIQKANLLKNEIHKFYKNYNLITDIKVASAMFQYMADNLEIQYKPEEIIYFNKISEKKKDRYIKRIFENSIFSDSARIAGFLETPSSNTLNNDKLFRLIKSFYKKYYEVYSSYQDIRYQLDEMALVYTKGLIQMNEGKKAMSPDANSSMRFSFGTVTGLNPSDAVNYSYFTTLKGVMEKEDSAKREFHVPEKLKILYENKDFGEYAVNSTMPVAFITNNDITGGNSGSPILNSEGHMIGIAFDGNQEGLIGEFLYDSLYQRTIGVDIRYVLFIIDKFGDAGYLLNEMKIIK